MYRTLVRGVLQDSVWLLLLLISEDVDNCHRDAPECLHGVGVWAKETVWVANSSSGNPRDDVQCVI